MNCNYKTFHRKQLPFNSQMLSFWNTNGFLVIENFYNNNECDKVIQRSKELIEDFDPTEYKSIFDTTNQKHAEDRYFLESGDKIRFFFENNSFGKNGKLINSKALVINKIGHALHDLDPEFSKILSSK